MYRMRTWSVHNARQLKALYAGVEWLLLRVEPLLRWVGYERLDRPFARVEKLTKGFFLDSQGCGQCIVAFTGLACPMNCPKSMRNGPCGGVRDDGNCEVKPDMKCVWVLAWEGNKRLGDQIDDGDYPIQVVQPPVDNRLIGRSAWLREVNLKKRALELAGDHEI